MKLTKLSLIAAMLIGSSAFAIENTKVSGDAKAYYGTQNSNVTGGTDFFDKEGGYTNFAAHLDLTTDLTEGISAGVGMQVVTTLGVEHNIVNNVWSSAHTLSSEGGTGELGGNDVDSAMWVDEAWIAGTAFDTTLKIGRQTLDTPLAFTETWGVDKNTFEAITLINQSIPDTTIVVTSIGKSNGSADNNTSGNVSGAAAGYVGGDGKFETFGARGTYAYGIINNSIESLTLQAWYYDMVQLAEAYWLQADFNMEGVLAGAQIANTQLDGETYLGINNPKDTDAWAAMLGYEMKDVGTFKIAYSDVDAGGALGVANTATGTLATNGGESKLYTEMWWNRGNVSAQGAESFSITAEANAMGADWFLGYFNADIENGNTADKEISEITLTASKSYGPLDTSIAIIHADLEDNKTPGNDKITTDLQVYLTYNF